MNVSARIMECVIGSPSLTTLRDGRTKYLNSKNPHRETARRRGILFCFYFKLNWRDEFSDGNNDSTVLQ